MNSRIVLSGIGRHGLGAVHMRTRRSWLDPVQALRRNNGGLREGCGLHCQHCDRSRGDQNSSLGLLHFFFPPSGIGPWAGKKIDKEGRQKANRKEMLAKRSSGDCSARRSCSPTKEATDHKEAKIVTNRTEDRARLRETVKGQLTGLTPLRNIRMEFALEALYSYCRHTSPYK